ncbi:hypothetical protein AsAng_0034720 [Aureispira anguillae]|uniref:Uncharacterized protein n=2 Tax=Aureispira anguillae TaxID=2864201 RepID=A0A916DUJ3_9BACT|nr:hypothetical protein AsAng_0034720 [Aureispira anguillae]
MIISRIGLIYIGKLFSFYGRPQAVYFIYTKPRKMKRKKLESLNLRLRKELTLSQQTCKVLREQLESIERQILKLRTEKEQFRRHYKAKKTDFELYVQRTESQALNSTLVKNIQLIRANKKACISLFSKLEREYLFSLGEDQKAKKQDVKYLLEQIENVLESL